MPEVREEAEQIEQLRRELVRISEELVWTRDSARRAAKNAQLGAAAMHGELVVLRARLAAAERVIVRLWCDDKPADSTIAALNEWAAGIPADERAALASALGEEDWVFMLDASEEAGGA